MKNMIIKSLVCDKQVRLFFVDNTALINEIMGLNSHSPQIVKVLLGKFVSGVSLLSATLKGEQRLSVTATFSNSNNKMFVDTDAYGNVRGYANQHLLSIGGTQTIQELIGYKASIRVIKGSFMNQFTGITDMPYQNIDENLSYYFKQSEQIETYINTDVAIGEKEEILHSYAIYAQLLPGAHPSVIQDVKERFNTKSSFFQALNRLDTQGIRERLKHSFHDIEIIGQHELLFACGCSKEMFFGLLLSLDKKELIEAIHRKESMATSCHICGRTYHFHPEELNYLL